MFNHLFPIAEQEIAHLEENMQANQCADSVNHHLHEVYITSITIYFRHNFPWNTTQLYSHDDYVAGQRASIQGQAFASAFVLLPVS